MNEQSTASWTVEATLPKSQPHPAEPTNRIFDRRRNFLEKYFDAQFHVRTYPDVAQSGINPLAHHLEIGWKKCCGLCAEFSTGYYLSKYPDMRGARREPFCRNMPVG